jgi:hypothetical protein
LCCGDSGWSIFTAAALSRVQENGDASWMIVREESLLLPLNHHDAPSCQVQYQQCPVGVYLSMLY